jgi:putative nucleotidyltransferase with HDIG domain
MPISARQLVKDINHLVTLPDLCLRMDQVLNDARSSAMDIANIVSQDPALTARILRIANSPYYGFPSKIDSVSRAITVIGTQDLYQLVLATSVIDVVDQTRIERDMLETFWRHSLMTGLVARDLARKCDTPVLQVERMFVAGLLHDIGSIVMALRIPELSKVMMRCADKLEMTISQAEQNVFDLDHGMVGAELMANWNLPEMLQQCARHHHEPEDANSHSLEVAIVHLANWACMSNEYSRFDFFYEEPISAHAMQLTGIDQRKIEHSLELAKVEFGAISQSFLQNSGRKTA